MPPRKPKPTAAEIAQEEVSPDAAEVAASYNGTPLDPVDGRPVFADGLSRARWLELHADERKAELVAKLLEEPAE